MLVRQDQTVKRRRTPRPLGSLVALMRRIPAGGAIGIAAVGAVAAAVLLPAWLIHTPLYPPLTKAADIAEAIATLRLHLLYLLGGLIAVVTLVFTHLRHQLERTRVNIERARLRDERFSAAVDQLSAQPLMTRLAGIHSLRAIFDEASADEDEASADERAYRPGSNGRSTPGQRTVGLGDLRGPIRSVTIAFAEAHTDPSAKTPADVIAAVELLGNLQPERLGGFILRGTSLQGEHLNMEDISASQLDGLNLRQVHFEVEYSYLAGFNMCNMTGANFVSRDRSEGSILHFELCTIDAGTVIAENEIVRMTGGSLRSGTLAGSDELVVLEVDLTGAKLRGRKLNGARNHWDPRDPPTWNDGPVPPGIGVARGPAFTGLETEGANLEAGRVHDSATEATAGGPSESPIADQRANEAGEPTN